MGKLGHYPNFGTNGGNFTSAPSYPTVATSALAVQASGDFVLLGTATQSLQTAFVLARYTPAGQLDTTFGTSGTVVKTLGGDPIALHQCERARYPVR